jgi:fatty acid desaturase
MMPSLKPMPSRSFFAYSRWDVVPALMVIGHLLFVGTLFFAFHHIPWAIWIPLALVYSISISWSINGSSHNLIHNPFFRSAWLNRAYSIILSLTDGFSQEFYHHRHGKDGNPESPWTYTFYSYFRDDIGDVYKHVKQKFPTKARWIWREIYILLGVYLVCLLYDWRAFLAMLPFYYLGHSLSSLNGYYEHFKGDPDTPMAWGVSTYNRFYNWIWIYNGYHAEHHYRPKMHWTLMRSLRDEIAGQQRAKGVHVMGHCHALGFLDRSPPAYTQLDPASTSG